MVTIKSKKEIELMREACRVTALVHKKIEEVMKYKIERQLGRIENENKSNNN